MICILGVITAQGEIDYEGGAEYKIEVKAQNPGTQLSSTAAILVHVTGVNEYKPEFLSRDYTFTIREDQQPGSSIGGVSATDADKGTDGVVYYYLVGDSNLQVCSEHLRNSGSNLVTISDPKKILYLNRDQTVIPLDHQDTWPLSHSPLQRESMTFAF